MSKKNQKKAIPPPLKLEDVIASIPDAIKNVKLAKAIKGTTYKEVTITRFSELMSDEVKNRKEIAQFIYDRFHQRYLLPFEKVPGSMNSGFAQMAVCCLMIEAMESFENGWADTREIYDDKGNRIGGGTIFENFFCRHKEFHEFKGLGKEFYDHVRCGILHQAETKNGWRLVRGWTDPILDKQSKAIHPTIFRERMRLALLSYYQKLEIGTEPTWKNFKIKMAYIIQNCFP